MSLDTPDSVLGCGLKILEVDEGAPWSDGVREAVCRALLDHAGGNPELRLKIELGMDSWRDARVFRHWLRTTLDVETEAV